MQKKIVIIGSGFSSLAAACYLAKQGSQVTILEKNQDNGGRARQLIRDGFTFDIGPTFYWMPDVFERFFADFGKTVADYYPLDRLDPGYQVYFKHRQSISIAADFNAIQSTFESIEKGSGKQLSRFMANAEQNYEIAIKDLVYKPGQSIFEIISLKTALRLNQFFGTIKKQVSTYIKNENLRKILEFPVLFLGAKPDSTPSFYNFMNYADFMLGTWHPRGGMYSVVKGMLKLAGELGVNIINNAAVKSIVIEGNMARRVITDQMEYEADIVLSGADYHHTETLIPKEFRQYSEKYWEAKTFAPSALLFFVGFDKKLKGVSHHTLFFDADFENHAETIYKTNTWPDDPLFYASFPSITDDSLTPKGKEAGIFLIPLAPDLKDSSSIRQKYFDIIIDRLEKNTEQELRSSILFQESFSIDDFKTAYNSYKGNAYGLANTLLQTHILRPKLKSKKVNNLFFTGQLTVPGPGVPPSLISGKIVSELINKYNG